MKTKLFPILILVLFIAVLPACAPGLIQVPATDTGSTRTFTLDKPLPATDAVQGVNLSMAVGELHLAGGAQSLLEGEVRYNLAEWKPVIKSREHSLTVSQGEQAYTVRSFPRGEVVNVWNVKLGTVPMNLRLRAAACDATLDLSGLPLQRLDVEAGASDVEVRFDTLNPEQMQSLNYETGLSDVRFLGLANADFAQMTFEGGAGDYTFDFSGDLQRDADVSIKAGLSDVTVVVPAGVSAEVFLVDGLASVYVHDAWATESGHYVNDGSGSQLNITIEMGAGSLRLVNR